MDGLYNLVTITQREYGEAFLACFHQAGCRGVTATLCEGTAQQKMLDRLGIEKTEKLMLSCIIPAAQAPGLLRQLRREMQLDVPGNGICYTIPLQSLARSAALANWPLDGKTEKQEVTEMEDKRFSLIVVIARRGCTDRIMDAARSVGATGGTIVHARGAAEKSGTFFGMSITSEKELLYIVARREDERPIMRAIMEQAGPKQGTLDFIFSLPVNQVVGLHSLTEE